MINPYIEGLRIEGRIDGTVQKEAERISRVGVALLIVSIIGSRDDPLIATVAETEAKEKTEKKVGQLSIPAETRKMGEEEKDNIIGALLEFCDDASFSYFREHLHFANDSYYMGALSVGNLDVDLAILIYDGSLEIEFNPIAQDVKANGWIRRSQIEAQDTGSVRSMLVNALALDRVHGLVQKTIAAFESGPDSRRSVSSFLGQDFSLSNFHREREKKRDVLDTLTT